MTTTSQTTASDNTLTLRRWITVGLPATELFALWLEPDTLPRIMSHFASVKPVNKSDAHWQIEGPLGKHYRWETRIVEAQPGEIIVWRSLEGADIPNEGELRLRPAPGEWGTELALTLHFTPPGGALGKKVTTLFDLLPKEVASKALHRFKSLAETGEIPTLQGQPAGRHAGHQDKEK
ncbi:MULTISPECIES: SRPBCC family protein [Pantoea]|uniref:SRPBCC family protein n=1 Tax=Pantoea TaxID=53335 RepID=UPI0007E56335|nr:MULTISPECIES: SRPBCC family protein [Pantoea]AOE42716.1 cyclase [Pantoea agglomerans]MBE5683771.1 SRPBCC family protein [Pantoea agglomerans]MBN9930706.1 SRPBCC family protein [Pantoea agglomerans]MDH1171629.1 SRPBCC family protein [Pantoea agglomerans]UJL39392.1 SRPBCC family protein [Pantoea agglomerans]